jgi:acetyltransferase-like isoleucine patch superfamily enzyme
MGVVGRITLKLKRGEGPFYRTLNTLAHSLLHANVPLPRFLRPVVALLYEFHFAVWRTALLVLTFFFWEPLFRSRCVQAGSKLHLTLLPRIVGRPRLFLGNGVKLFGDVTFAAQGGDPAPEIILGDNVQIGHRVTFAASRQIIIEENAGVASDCYITDSDAPRADSPYAGELSLGGDARPVRICRMAWVGRGSCVLKGVTIGEGSIIGAGSVVIGDIPPFCVAMGNPARVVMKVPSQ